MHTQKGFSLLLSIVVTSILLVISFVVSNIAYRQLVISSTNKESQYAFYAANSGVDCAIYWDLTQGTSRFSTSTAGTINCGGTSISTGSQTVNTVPSQSSRIGGGGNLNPTSIFMFNVVTNKSCAIVSVTKSYNGSTLETRISSKGYNTCDVNNARRVERGVEITY